MPSTRSFISLAIAVNVNGSSDGDDDAIDIDSDDGGDDDNYIVNRRIGTLLNVNKKETGKISCIVWIACLFGTPSALFVCFLHLFVCLLYELFELGALQVLFWVEHWDLIL